MRSATSGSAGSMPTTVGPRRGHVWHGLGRLGQGRRMRYVVVGAGAIGSGVGGLLADAGSDVVLVARGDHLRAMSEHGLLVRTPDRETDRKSTRLNSSHVKSSYAVFCLKRKD